MKLGKLFTAYLIIVSFLIIAPVTGFSQKAKVRYVDSEAVLKKYPAAQEIQKKMQKLKETYESDFLKMQQDYQKQLGELEKQSLLLSKEKRSAKEDKLRNAKAKLERHYYEKFGPQGELFQKNKELYEPLIAKIQNVIQKIGKNKEYDYILDKAQGIVLFGKAEYDITEQVIEELNKTK